MWRGYGANGNGVAIVFDTGQMEAVEQSALIIAPVAYASNEARLRWLEELILKFARILGGSEIPNELLYVAANNLFERIKQFALYSKHHGFKEENEWRVVYFPDRDPEQKLKPMFGYWISGQGLEPKLKFKVEPMAGMVGKGLSLDTIIDQIILGPSSSSPLALNALKRMVQANRPALTRKVWPSTIPFRPISNR
jgi:hypothetical protein